MMGFSTLSHDELVVIYSYEENKSIFLNYYS